MVISKTESSYLNLIEQLKNRSVKRTYLAMVVGEPVSSKTIDEPIGRHPKIRTKQAIIKNGKEAITRFSKLESFKGYSLLRVNLETGRTHQIRVHLSHIGYPIIGDPVYGNRNKFSIGTNEDLKTIISSFNRQALHAEGLELILWEANEAHMVADEIAKAGVPVVLDPLNNIPGTFDSLNATYENVARLNAAGVKMAFYYNQGAGSHNAYLATQSAGNAVAMGVPYNEALNAITKNPADIFGLVDVGQVSVGFEGDIAIWDADPLELTSFVEKVLIDGVEQDLSNRYEELTDRYTKEKDLPNSYRSRE